MDKNYEQDVNNIQALPIVPAILDLVCKTTGMGFAAVARVTNEKWIACATKDDIGFGLKPGGELLLETTICNEIKDHKQPVIIDEVSQDEHFKHHHTPKQYGFESYISIPIILKDGTFFGTLCAIDPQPRQLFKSDALTIFTLYADLISFHLLFQDHVESQNKAIEQVEFKLQQSLSNVRQYEFISRHTLQEPLRKLSIFSDILENDKDLPMGHKAKVIATKIKSLAGEFITMIKHLTDFSDLDGKEEHIQPVDVNLALNAVINRLQFKIAAKQATIHQQPLAVIPAIPQQMSQLLYHIIDNALTFSIPTVPPVINIYGVQLSGAELANHPELNTTLTYYKLCIADNGIGIDKNHYQKIFYLFSRLNKKEEYAGLGMGLTQSKKIMQHHNGLIIVDSEPNKGATFSLIFPLTHQV